MKNISLIIFILFNYFFIQRYFENKNIKINTENSYQKTYNEQVDEGSQAIFKDNILEDKKEIIYLY
jgi:hypothetical protein